LKYPIILLLFWTGFCGNCIAQSADVFVSYEASYAIKVNNGVITSRQYNTAADLVLKEIKKSGEVDLGSDSGIELLKLALRSAIDEMINSSLMTQGTASFNITVTDSEIQKKINEVKAGFPSDQDFHKSLAVQGITVADLNNDIKKQIIRSKITGRLEKDIKIEQMEINDFYKRNLDLFVQPQRIGIRTITVNTRPVAEEIEKSLKEGADFVELAITKSIDKNAKDGGTTGFVEKNDLPVNVWDNIAGLKKGQTSSIIRTITGYQLIRVDDKIDPKEIKVKDASERIKDFLINEKSRSLFDNWIIDQRSKANISYDQNILWVVK